MHAPALPAGACALPPFHRACLSPIFPPQHLQFNPPGTVSTMPSFSIESNGRLEATTIYYNGEQLGGVREVFLNLDEDGTFDAILQYVGSDGETYTKQIFNDHLENLTVTDPGLTEDEARARRLLTVESSGDIEDTIVLL